MTDVTTETATGFDALKGLTAAAEDAAPAVQKLDAQGRAYSTGKRKNAIARVWVKPGTGKFTVNGKEMPAYFARPTLQMIVNQPFEQIQAVGRYDIVATVAGEDNVVAEVGRDQVVIRHDCRTHLRGDQRSTKPCAACQDAERVPFHLRLRRVREMDSPYKLTLFGDRGDSA